MSFLSYTLIVMIPVMLFAAYAQNKIKRTYRQYEQMPVASNLSGEDTVRALLRENAIEGVSLDTVRGTLSDHYDPRTRTLRLSDGVAKGRSIAAVGVAAHETGHALQHQNKNALLVLRNRFAPAARIGSSLAIPLVFVGYFIGWLGLARIGVWLFGAVVLFQLITVPVELDASKKALAMLRTGDHLQGSELTGAKRVLDAAALTYIASLAVALAQLFRLLLLTRDD